MTAEDEFIAAGEAVGQATEADVLDQYLALPPEEDYPPNREAGCPIQRVTVRLNVEFAESGVVVAPPTVNAIVPVAR